MVYVPGGEFSMGDDLGEAKERPGHVVFLDGFWIDKGEVTNGMYELCVTAEVCEPPASISSATRPSYYGNSSFSQYPVIWVTWSQAEAYCGWVAGRLPTEAEWEKAARGTDNRIYPWGNEYPTADLLNFGWNMGDTTAEGSYPDGASPYGALDMSGNVWEWAADWFGETYYAISPASNPPGPESGTTRVVRGGAWGAIPRDVRTAYRIGLSPADSFDIVGFRCVVTP